MMMVLHVIATGCCREVQLMAGEAETPTGGCECAVKLIIGIFHAVLGKYGFQATLIEWPVVSHKRQALYQWLYLCPDFRECRLPVGVAPGKAMHLGSPVCIVIRGGLNERVKLIDNLSPAHNDYADAAHAASASVGCLKIYRCKICIICRFFSKCDTIFVFPYMVIHTSRPDSVSGRNYVKRVCIKSV